MREDILGALPEGWGFEGKVVLDFGCGAGRTLRHFTDEARSCELWGCDIDAASVAWLDEHLCPPLHVFTNGTDPPLPHPDGKFDLIWAVSVFTHLTDAWSRWLLELRRVLAQDGLIYVTFMGAGTSQEVAGEPWDESRYGMNVLCNGQGWELGGPMVLHSPWWIRARWGRAFEILSLKPSGFAGEPGAGHGAVMMRKRPVQITPAELEAIDPDEPREGTALAHQVGQLLEEVADLRRVHVQQRREHAAGEALRADLERELAESGERREELELRAAELELRAAQLELRAAELEHRLTVIAGSKSWALTRPLRMLAAGTRRRRR